MSKETEKEKRQQFAEEMYFNHMSSIRKTLTEDPTFVNSSNQRSYSWLMRAVGDGNLAQVKLLMEFNPDTTVQLKDSPHAKFTTYHVGETALHRAAQTNKSDILDAILKEDRRALNMVDELGWSPIMIAVRDKNIEATLKLLEYEPDLGIKSNVSNDTVFTIAALHSDPTILQALHEAKARQEGNVIAQVASLEEGKDQKPSSDLPLPPPPTVGSTSEGDHAITDALTSVGAGTHITDNSGNDPAYYAKQDVNKEELVEKTHLLVDALTYITKEVEELQSLKKRSVDISSRATELTEFIEGMTNLLGGTEEIKSLREQSKSSGSNPREQVVKSLGNLILHLKERNALKSSQEAPLGNEDSASDITSPNQKPSSDLPLPASQPPIPPQTQIAQVSSDTPMQPVSNGKERG